MDFLAILDYEHLDNGVFLTSFAKSLAQKEKRGLIIHGDSEHTERIIQTGVMRDEARIRAIKELNHRLVALFADEGVSTIALNGFQYVPVPLTKMATALSIKFEIDEVTIFSIDESSDFIKQDLPEHLNIRDADKSFIEKHIPEKLRDLSTKVRVKTGSSF